jgi:hypothetical protein
MRRIHRDRGADWIDEDWTTDEFPMARGNARQRPVPTASLHQAASESSSGSAGFPVPQGNCLCMSLRVR